MIVIIGHCFDQFFVAVAAQYFVFVQLKIYSINEKKVLMVAAAHFLMLKLLMKPNLQQVKNLLKEKNVAVVVVMMNWRKKKVMIVY